MKDLENGKKPLANGANAGYNVDGRFEMAKDRKTDAPASRRIERFISRPSRVIFPDGRVIERKVVPVPVKTIPTR